MKKLFSILLFSIFVSTQAAAQKAASSSSSVKHREVDISHLMKKPEALPEDQKEGGLHLNVTCKTESGKVLSTNDSGYNDCMNNAANKAAESARKPK
jgi:hypothetical protein